MTLGSPFEWPAFVKEHPPESIQKDKMLSDRLEDFADMHPLLMGSPLAVSRNACKSLCSHSTAFFTKQHAEAHDFVIWETFCNTLGASH